MRSMLGVFVLVLLTAGCGPIAPKFIPSGGQPGSPNDAPAPAGSSRAPATAAPATPTATPVPTRPAVTPPAVAPATPEDAIRLAQQRFPELSAIHKKVPGSIGADTDIIVQPRGGGWNLIFWQGSGDCPSGCINQHYWYVSVDAGGSSDMAGQFSRTFDGGTNAVKTQGAPMWGVPQP